MFARQDEPHGIALAELMARKSPRVDLNIFFSRA